MAQPPVQPLNLSKATSNSPFRMQSRGALSEISPMGIRRNSPSFGLEITANSQDKPYLSQNLQTLSSRNLFENRNVEPNGVETHPFSRRSSLEKLQKASRVRNSNIFRQDGVSPSDPFCNKKHTRYSPSRQPLNSQANENFQVPNGIKANEATSSSPLAMKDGGNFRPVNTWQSLNQSNIGSSNFNADDGTWSDEDTVQRGLVFDKTPKAGSRHNKTVSFDAAPPQVNEYEMVTPDLSSIASGSREGSYDLEDHESELEFEQEDSVEENEDSFDESLEDTHKTPVVLPEEWRFGDSRKDIQDIPLIETQSFTTGKTSSHLTDDKAADDLNGRILVDSIGVSEEFLRPLPPLPVSAKGSVNSSPTTCKDEKTRAASLPRTSQSRFQPPRPASVSKAEILGMRDSPMPLGERLRLLELQDQQKSPIGKTTVSHSSTPDIESINVATGRNLDEDFPQRKSDSIWKYTKPPKISRESILRNVNDESQEEYLIERKGESLNYSNLDPDVPVPSSEIASNSESFSLSSGIKIEERCDSPSEAIYSYPEVSKTALGLTDGQNEVSRESSVIRHTQLHVELSKSPPPGGATDDDVSMVDNERDSAKLKESTFPIEGAEMSYYSVEDSRMGLPDFIAFFEDDDFGHSLKSYMTPSPSDPKAKLSSTADETSKAYTCEHQESTREEKASNLWGALDDEESQVEIMLPPVSDSGEAIKAPREVFIPEKDATIKAPGTSLKTRPSLSPGDLILGTLVKEREEHEDACFLPQKHWNETAHSNSMKGIEGTFDELAPVRAREDSDEKVELMMPFDIECAETGLGLEKEFDRLVEAKNKGYLTRQNTKVVIASNRDISAEHLPALSNALNSKSYSSCEPEESSYKAHEITKYPHSGKSASNTWTTEPWNGRMRRQSTRKSILSAERTLKVEAVSQLPGTQSNVMPTLEEMKESQFLCLGDEDEERGRLFVKVSGVRNLDLPLPANEKNWFQLTLDNGLHCVTTSWLELSQNAPIGQEFELTVFADLDFQLTLQTKLERPRSQASTSSIGEPAVKTPKSQKASALSRFLSSPRKRKELQKKQKTESQVQAIRSQTQSQGNTNKDPSTSWDLLHNLIGPDGSFARSYVSLKDYETRAFGRPLHVDIPCYNEWAIEDKSPSGSTHSKLGGIQRKPPYQIGTLELQLLYVPKPRGTKDEDMPQSMSACIKELKLAEEEALRTTTWEGFLSQQGGDCPYWRRRFFRLDGKSLISYHETTRQRRANINLSKATKLIDDRSVLTQPNAAGVKDSRRRRKSAFAEEEEGYMFVEEGFRIRFGNGEVIDFYADNAEDKSNWMKALSDVVGKVSTNGTLTWAKVILAKENSEPLGSLQKLSSHANGPVKTEVRPIDRARPQSMIDTATQGNGLANGAGYALSKASNNRKAVQSMII